MKNNIEFLNKIELNKTLVQKVNDEFLDKFGIELFVKRIDLIHKEISGNKWYKLKYNLLEANQKGFDCLLTFGGAYSNHIHAVASAGHLLEFRTIGVIRGEQHLPLNPTLTNANEYGMKIHYMSREKYRHKTEDSVLKELKNIFGDFYLIPEGGTNLLAVKGTSEILDKTDSDYNFVATACGTGGTLAGIISSLSNNQKAIGFAVLKNASFLISNVANLLTDYKYGNGDNWSINLDYHFGGYARLKPELINFIETFESKTNIKLEPIYTGKMFYGIYDLISKSYFPSGTKILAIHTGGLQGIRGLKQRKLIL